MKKFRTKYDNVDVVSPSGGISMTDQQYRDECSIDVILKRYKAGQPLPVHERKGSYGDFSDVGDFMSCFDRINAAREDFAALPSEIRARFGNDVTAFYNFVLDPSNIEECAKLGLCEIVPNKVSPSKVEKSEKAEPAKNGEGNASNT